ncbi:MAG: ATP-binding protein [Bacteroidetes bacterium]|nr:ATP-binding protein [Bacteroidota bacterium]
MLKTVLRNLMANAVKYTPEGGKVDVNATLNESNVTISVSDTGIGMDSEVSDSLFKIEGNISRPGTHGEKGTGLGLLLCKEFIDAHKGRIWVQSSPNNGSTFWIVIPSKQNT